MGLSWTAQRLAQLVDVSTTTVINFESGQINTTRMIQKAFKKVFEQHGVVFLEG